MALNQIKETCFLFIENNNKQVKKNDHFSRLLLSVKMSSERDKAILNSILNPFLPLGSDFDTGDNEDAKDGNFFK